MRPPPSVMCDFCLRASHRGSAPPVPKPAPPFQDRIRPIPPLPCRQLEMTGCENASDIRGRPAWAFGGAAPSRLPRRVPRTRRRRRGSPLGSPAPVQTPLAARPGLFWDLSVYLAGFLTLLRAPPWTTRPSPVYLLVSRLLKCATWYTVDTGQIRVPCKPNWRPVQTFRERVGAPQRKGWPSGRSEHEACLRTSLGRTASFPFLTCEVGVVLFTSQQFAVRVDYGLVDRAIAPSTHSYPV